MTDWDLVYAAAKDSIGDVKTYSLGRMSALQFQRFAVAAGDKSRCYFDDEHARLQGYPAAIAPPLFLSSVLGWEAGPDEDCLRPDGAGRQEIGSLPLAGLRLMGAGQELEFFQPIVEGCQVTEEVSVDTAELKQGKQGKFLIFTLLRRYFDESRGELLRCRESFIAR